MRTPKERFLEPIDGTKLFYRYWPATDPPSNRALILFHRGHEHSGRLQHVVDELNLPGFAMFAWDSRGYGRSFDPKETSPSFGMLIEDVDTFVRHVSCAYGVTLETIGG